MDTNTHIPSINPATDEVIADAEMCARVHFTNPDQHAFASTFGDAFGHRGVTLIDCPIDYRDATIGAARPGDINTLLGGISHG